jgi:hypothetical protein
VIGADALFGLYDEVDCQKLLPERKVAVLEDSASGNGSTFGEPVAHLRATLQRA